MESLIGKSAGVCKVVGYVCLVMLTTVLVVGVIARYFFNSPIPWTDEMAMAIMVPLVTIPLAYVFEAEGHIRIDLVTRHLKPKLQYYLERVVDILTVIFLSIMVKTFYTDMNLCLWVDRRWPTMWWMPMWPVRLIGLLGLSFAIIYLVLKFILKVRNR